MPDHLLNVGIKPEWVEGQETHYDFTCSVCGYRCELIVPAEQQKDFDCPQHCGALYSQVADGESFKLYCSAVPM
jgi:hypothetical protein